MKIVKIESGEELLNMCGLFEHMRVIVEYEKGVQGTVLMTPEQYNKELFKNELISKGYDEKDLEKFEELTKEECTKYFNQNYEDYD